MSDTAGIDSLVVTSDERTMGTLAHVLQLVGGWIAPLVIFLVKRNSRFVSFHALQVLLFQGLHFLVMLLTMGEFMAAVLAGFLFRQPETGHNSLAPGFVVLFPALFIGVMGWWLVILLLAIIYGIKASKGEWAEYPLLGRLARRILRIGPGGEPIS